MSCTAGCSSPSRSSGTCPAWWRLYVELGVDGPEFLVGGGFDDLEVDLVEDVDEVGQDLLVAEVVVLADLRGKGSTLSISLK